MLDKIPITEALQKRIALILIEEINRAESGIPTFIELSTLRLLELIKDEIKYGQRIS